MESYNNSLFSRKIKNSLFFLILQFPPNKCVTDVIPGGHGKKGLIRTAARSILAKEKQFECVLYECIEERPKRNCPLSHGNRKLKSSHKLKGEKPKHFVVVKTEKYWKKLPREMLASLSLKGFTNRLYTSFRNDS